MLLLLQLLQRQRRRAAVTGAHPVHLWRSGRLVVLWLLLLLRMMGRLWDVWRVWKVVVAVARGSSVHLETLWGGGGGGEGPVAVGVGLGLGKMERYVCDGMGGIWVVEERRIR